MSYTRAAFDSELAKLGAAQPGNQDNTINEVFFALAGMVKGQWFTEFAVQQKAFPIVLGLPQQGAPFTRKYCETKWKNAMRAAKPRPLPGDPQDKKGHKKRYAYKNGRTDANHTTSNSERQSYTKASFGGNEDIPQWTPPNEKGQPIFIAGEDLPKIPGEIRRHIYRNAAGRPVRAKIKLQKQNIASWLDFYYVGNRKAAGWQPKRPAGYSEVPYFLNEGIAPLDVEFSAQNLFWTEGEKDAETLARAGACAFTFGGSSTFIDASDLVRGRHLILLADNDEAGRKWAAKQASIAARACASIKTYTFPQLDEKGDASDFLAKHSLEELESIIAQLPNWQPNWNYGGELLGNGIAIPPPMIVKRILPAQGLCFIGGQSEAGKTYAAIALTLAIASGTAFLGFNVHNQAAVIYCAAEGDGVIDNRFAIAKAQMQLDGQLPILLLKRPGYINDDFEAFLADMRGYAEWLRNHFNLQYCVFVLDTRMAGWRMEDENSNEEAGEVCAALRSIGPEIGGPAIVVHHYGKTKEQGLRGASAWTDNCDHVISIFAEKDSVTGDVGKREIAISRSRFSPTGTIGEFELQYEKLGIDAAGDEFGDCYIKFLGKTEAVIHEAEPQKRGRGRKKGGGRGDLILRNAIENAIVTYGVVHAVGGDGPLVTAAKALHVRTEFYRMYITGQDTTIDIFEVRRKAWSRAIANIDLSIYGTETKGETEWIWKL